MSVELNKAFDALKTFDWGQKIEPLDPIDAAIVASHGKEAETKELETRLLALLKTSVPRDAKDFICRKLAVIGTAESVPTLAGFLGDKENSHMARYALERIPAPEAATAMRDALAKVDGQLKIGMMTSLGSRRDVASVPAIAALLSDSNAAIAAAAAHALADIGDKPAANALSAALKTASPASKPAVVDASLVCADHLLAEGNKATAMAIYKSLGGPEQPKYVRFAAKQGLITAIKKK